jgi:hypothetical protein
LADANQVEQNGNRLGAQVLRASAYYSHVGRYLMKNLLRAWVLFRAAKNEVRRILGDTPAPGDHNLTDGQCDVIGTILLRRWLWEGSEPAKAMLLFNLGLAQEDVPPHSRALMTIGLAEACYLLGEHGVCVQYIDAAIAIALLDGDTIHHKRQCCRVWRRAAVLMHKLGKRQPAKTYWERALADATHPIWGSKDQLNKIHQERFKLRWLWWLQWLLPH